MMIVMLIGSIVFSVWLLRNPCRSRQKDDREKDFAAVVLILIFSLSATVIFANAYLNPRIVVKEGTLVRRATRLLSYDYRFDIGEPYLDEVTLSAFSAKDIIQQELSIGSRYRYYCEGRTGELLGIERIAGE